MELGNLLFGSSRGPVPVDRDRYTRIFRSLLAQMVERGWNSYEPFETAVFSFSPYCWADCDCDKAEPDDEHDSDCPLAVPNFMHKPSGFWVRIYKYPWRDSYASHDLNDEQLTTLASECEASLPSLHSIHTESVGG